MRTTDDRFDFSTADFDAVYLGGEFLPGSSISTVPWDVGRAQPAVTRLHSAGRVHGRVLDVGCGLGENAVFLASEGYDVVAVDASSVAVEKTRERAAEDGVTVDARIADATDLEALGEKFDTVVDSALYHTLDDLGRRRYLASAARVGAPGATLNLVCFAAVDGGMPEPLAVREDDLRGALDAAGWDVLGLERTEFLGVSTGMTDFLDDVAARVRVDENGHTRLPVWDVHAALR